MDSDILLTEKINSFLPLLPEKLARIYLATEAKNLGRGGKQKISKIAKTSRARIDRGLKDLSEIEESKVITRSRKAGGGRKKLIDKEEMLLAHIEEIVSPHTRGNPMNVLLWTSKSVRNIAKELRQKGIEICHKTVSVLLLQLGFSLQANKKTDEGAKEEDRNEQFEYINATAISFMQNNCPVISVDCKKKELIGNYKNNGVEWEVKKEPLEVKVYDFIDKELGKAVPYGVYDVARNEGFVNVGISSDTAEFAVNSIRNWWQLMGKELYKNAKQIMITADSGGSNSTRGRLWKVELQKLATEISMEINVCHYPPGTSKWNKIEHKMFSFISMNWRAKPLISLEVIVNLIANTTTESGLKIRAEKDENTYLKGIKISNEEMTKLNWQKKDFRGDWNYIISP